MAAVEHAPQKSSQRPRPTTNSSPTQPGLPSAAAFSTSLFYGPIPPPDMLKQYDIMLPGVAEKFLLGPHLEAEHRRTLEKTMVEEKIRLSKRGQWMGFCLALICILVAFAAIFLGYSIAGLGTLLIAAGSFSGVFIYARRHQVQGGV